MKGIQALIVAAGLGIAGAILNFFYLFPASQEREPGLLHRRQTGADHQPGRALEG